jgi:hypothetical protein
MQTHICADNSAAPPAYFYGEGVIHKYLMTEPVLQAYQQSFFALGPTLDLHIPHLAIHHPNPLPVSIE